MEYKKVKYDKQLNNEVLFEKAKLGCDHSKNLLIQNSIPLVVALAKRWSRVSTYTDIDELISIGMIGLMKAYRYFDPSKKNKFSTLAGTAVWQHFINFARKSKRSVRTKYDAVSFDVDELCNEVSSRHETITDEKNMDVYVETENRVYSETLQVFLNSEMFNENEKMVANGYFINGKSLSDIARENNVSRQNIHQMYKRCISKIAKDGRMIS
ncbi:sigma-70 family RNA polymerase sigma factor [Paenibacillus sp. GCM10027627]|uniref:sigma-70 family RNA polymerase sigma factor n=1 Tax=unclassified Paenibacillus TaxID=185978 RepID=UPI00362641B1